MNEERARQLVRSKVLSQEEAYILHSLFTQKQICSESMKCPRLLSTHSVYYLLLQNDWSALCCKQNWGELMSFVQLVSIRPDIPCELSPKELSVQCIPFCLSFVYMICMMVKRGSVEETVELWNGVSGSRSDQCQALYKLNV